MESKINYLIKQCRNKFYLFGKIVPYGEGIELEAFVEIIPGDCIILEYYEKGFFGTYQVVERSYWKNVSPHDFFLLVEKVK